MKAGTPPRSKWALVMYAIAACYAGFQLIESANMFARYGMLSDHDTGLEQIVRVIRDLIPAASIVTLGLGLQYLADIRWLLMNPESNRPEAAE